MPFMGLLGFLHIIIAVCFAVHAVRTGRQLFWLFILFSFPMLGSVVYFLVEYLPSSRLKSGFKGAVSIASKALNPDAELRAAQKAVDLTPTVQNRMRLAKALMAKGDSAKAVEQLDQCLTGQFANDPDIGFIAATAKFQNKQPADAIHLLNKIRQRNPEFRQEQVSVLLAQALVAAGDHEKAKQEFIHAVSTYGSVEARAEYAIWAASTGDTETALKLREDLEHSWKHWNTYARSQHRELFSRVDKALAAAKK